MRERERERETERRLPGSRGLPMPSDVVASPVGVRLGVG